MNFSPSLEMLSFQKTPWSLICHGLPQPPLVPMKSKWVQESGAISSRLDTGPGTYELAPNPNLMLPPADHLLSWSQAKASAPEKYSNAFLPPSNLPPIP